MAYIVISKRLDLKLNKNICVFGVRVTNPIRFKTDNVNFFLVDVKGLRRSRVPSFIVIRLAVFEISDLWCPIPR